MLNFEIDNSALSRRIIQAVCDIAHRPLSGLRVLNLACARGHYSFEMGTLGESSVHQALFCTPQRLNDYR